MSVNKTLAVGDVWHRVDGTWIDDGSEVYCGMELKWSEWRCVKLTRCGGWFRNIEVPRYGSPRKDRFVIPSSAKALSPTKQEALERLVARKKRQLVILENQRTMAEDTLSAARAALAATEGGEG